jgi:hypothetical protein
VLDNDADPDGPLTGAVVTVISAPAEGTASVGTFNTISYTAAPMPSASQVSFVYQLCDATSRCDQATVVVTVNRPPVVADPGTVLAVAGESLSLVMSGTDPDGAITTWDATGLPPGLALNPVTGAMVGTVGAAARGNDYTVTVTATDDGTPALTDTVTFTIEVDDYQRSSLAGRLVIDEVLPFATVEGGAAEYVEIVNVGATPVDLNGLVLRNFGTEGAADDFTYTVGPTDLYGEASVLAPGQRAVVWMTLLLLPGRPVPPGTLEYVDPTFAPLDQTGDDIWLYDDTGAIVDYVAWGDETGAPLAALGFWDASDQYLLLPVAGLSLSLTPSGADGDTASCWEATGSGTAAARCPGAITTTGVGWWMNYTGSPGAPNH